MRLADIRLGDRLLCRDEEVVVVFVGGWDTDADAVTVLSYPGGTALAGGAPDALDRRARVGVVPVAHLDRDGLILTEFVSASSLRTPQTPRWAKHGNTKDYITRHDGVVYQARMLTPAHSYRFVGGRRPSTRTTPATYELLADGLSLDVTGTLSQLGQTIANRAAA